MIDDTKSKKVKQGHETCIAEYGRFVIKRPRSDKPYKRQNWLAKQHQTKDVTDAIRAVGNPTYNIPETHFVNDDDFRVLEDFAPGAPLKIELWQTLSMRQQYEIVTSLAGFLVDMNESRPIGMPEPCKVIDDDRDTYTTLGTFIENRMSKWFTYAEVQYMAHVHDILDAFEYESCRAWSHGDLNSENVLYDADNSKLWIIDFADASYNFIYRDIYSPIATDLGICHRVYETYRRFHNSALYQLPGANAAAVRKIMAYRKLWVLSRRFVKATRDLRTNPMSEDGVKNTLAKVQYMRELMIKMRALGFQK